MKKAIKIVTNVLAWTVLILALLVTVMVFSSSRNNGVANLFGMIPMTVESDSMLPTFAQGDLIICKQVDDLNALKENDVITFWTIIDGKKVKNTHRIVEIVNTDGVRSFITRGDNNSIDDDIPVYAGDLIGKWTDVRLAGVGKAVNFLRTKTGFFICILLPMALFFLFELYKFIVTLIEIKRPAAEPALDEEEIKRRAIEEYLAQQKQNEAAAKPAEPAKDTAEKAAEKVTETAEKAAETVAETAEKAAETVAETAEKAAETVTGTAEKAAETVTGTAEKAAETVTETAEKAAETVTETAEKAAETVAETAEKAAETTAETAEKAAEKAAEAAEQAADGSEKN